MQSDPLYLDVVNVTSVTTVFQKGTLLLQRNCECHSEVGGYEGEVRGEKHGAHLRMRRLRRREAGSLAKRPFKMDATSIMRLSLRRSSLGLAKKRYTLPSLPIRSTCKTQPMFLPTIVHMDTLQFCCVCSLRAGSVGEGGGRQCAGEEQKGSEEGDRTEQRQKHMEQGTMIEPLHLQAAQDAVVQQDLHMLSECTHKL